MTLADSGRHFGAGTAGQVRLMDDEDASTAGRHRFRDCLIVERGEPAKIQDDRLDTSGALSSAAAFSASRVIGQTSQPLTPCVWRQLAASSIDPAWRGCGDAVAESPLSGDGRNLSRQRVGVISGSTSWLEWPMPSLPRRCSVSHAAAVQATSWCLCACSTDGQKVTEGAVSAKRLPVADSRKL